MSLFTLYAWACIAAGFALAITTAAGTDAAGFVWAALLGAGKGFAFYLASMLGLFTLLWLWLQLVPPEPRCRQGRCGPLKYRPLDPATLEDGPVRGLAAPEEGRWLMRCGCQDLYLKDERAGRFLAVTEEGRAVPFRRRGRFGRWEAEALSTN